MYYNAENDPERSQAKEIKISYLFPPKSAEDAKIRHEVNSILAGALRELLRRGDSNDEG